MSAVRKVLKRIVPQGALDQYYRACAHRAIHGRWPRIVRPRTFSEKVLRSIMFDRRPLLTRLADKYSSRAYVEERLGSHVLPRLYHATEDASTIPWDALPDRYVIKGAHGSGWVKLVTGAVDREAVERLCTGWLRRNYFKAFREWPYKHIVPRIVIEELLDDGTCGVPLDYKFFVFDGKPAVIQVDGSRFIGHTRSFYDLSWKRLPVTLKWPPLADEIPKPLHLAEMLDAASILGRGVDFLRVDLYDTPKQFYVGELTTTPVAGLEAFTPTDFDEWLGKLWR